MPKRVPQRPTKESDMPILPLDHPEPFAAVVGTMLYPGTDDDERKRAAAFAAHYLAEPVRLLKEEGGALSREDLERIVMDGGEPLGDLDQPWYEGTATGEIFKTLFALAHKDPKLASWDNAIKIAEKVAAGQKKPGSRTGLWNARSQFLSVAHLWAAWSIRGSRFKAQPEAGYDGWLDFQFFLAEAEILRRWGQTFQQPRAKADPPLPADVWRVPDGWAPPERLPGWPESGRVPVLTLPDELLAGLKRAGRPRKST